MMKYGMEDKRKYKKAARGALAVIAALICFGGLFRLSASASDAPVFGVGGSDGKQETGSPDMPVEVTEDSVIPEGVYIGETPVGGMTIGEAREQLAEQESRIRLSAFTVTHGEKSLTIPFEELGLYFEDTTDILYDAAKIGRSGTLLERYKALKDLKNDKIVCTWTYDFDRSALEERVVGFAEEVDQECVESTITRVSGAFVVTPSQNGIAMDVEATLDRVRTSLEAWNGDSVSIEAVVTVQEPKYTYEALSTIQDIIADFATPMGADIEQGRGKNVARGAELINGTVLLPGETFSAHDALVPFTAANGYDIATAFNQGRYSDSVGGGVCSLTSTLYNAVMYAELQVDRRYNHSMVVSYARPGFDSTVNDDGSKDLVFTNNLDYPIYIEARAFAVNEVDGQCYFAIWGTKTPEMAARDVSLYYEVIEQEDAVYNWEIHPELQPGEEKVMQSAYPRMVVNAYKKVEVNGVVVSDEYLHTDYYIRSDGIIWHNPINP